MKKAIFVSLVLVSATASVFCAGVIDNLPFFGISTEYNLRRGYLDLGSSRAQELSKKSFPTFGVKLGKRWRLARNVRAQAAGAIGYGSVVEETLPQVNGIYEESSLCLRFFHGGIYTDLHGTFAHFSDGALFLHGGIGGHIVKAEESEIVLGGNPVQGIADGYPESNLMASGSIQGGIGFEAVVSPRFGFAIVYSLRYWRPIFYPMVRDLFPYKPMEYHERFLSHEIDVQFLVKRY